MSYTWSMRENEGKWLLWHFPSSFAGSLGLAWRVFQSVGGVCVCLFSQSLRSTPEQDTGSVCPRANGIVSVFIWEQMKCFRMSHPKASIGSSCN